MRTVGADLSPADQQAKRLAGRLGAERAYRILGHRIDATYSLEKVMWVRENEPERYARTRHVCLAKDYVTWHLTGRRARRTAYGDADERLG